MTEKNKTGCYLYSKANYSTRITYNGETIILPPFANKYRISDESKLGELPSHVKKISMSKQVNDKMKITDSKKEGRR